MSEKIPADIMKTAQHMVDLQSVWLRDDPLSTCTQLIARAILAERRRCAAAYMHWARKMMEEVEKE